MKAHTLTLVLYVYTQKCVPHLFQVISPKNLAAAKRVNLHALDVNGVIFRGRGGEGRLDSTSFARLQARYHFSFDGVLLCYAVMP